MTDSELIDTRIYGASEDVRAAARKLYEIYEALEQLSSLFKGKLRTNFYAWDGDAAHSYDEAAVSMGAKVQTFSDRFYSAYQSLQSYAQQLDYHYRSMQSIREQAEYASLAIINDYDILPPDPIPEPTLEKCYAESYGPPPSIGPQVGSPDGKFSHNDQIELYQKLEQEAQDVRDDLEKWIRKNLRSVQEECAALVFARKVSEGTVEYLRNPWQLLPDVATTSWDTATSSYASIVDTLAEGAALEQSSFKMMPAAITEDSLGRFASMSDESVSKMRGIGRGLSKVGTVIGVGVLGYEVVKSDTPAQKAVTGGLGLAAGTLTGGIVADAVIGMAGGSLAGPAGIIVGGLAGAATGLVVGLTTEAHADTLYEQIPLEYRDRADAFVSHVPYYMFGGSW